MEQEVFAESKGLPANEHAKKLAKEKSKKSKKKFDSFFSQRGQKVVKITFKQNGSYQEYVGSLANKKEAPMLKTEIVKWKKDGYWIEEHNLDEVSSKKIAALNK